MEYEKNVVNLYGEVEVGRWYREDCSIIAFVDTTFLNDEMKEVKELLNSAEFDIEKILFIKWNNYETLRSIINKLKDMKYPYLFFFTDRVLHNEVGFAFFKLLQACHEDIILDEDVFSDKYLFIKQW